jgi:hypothetical protein
MGGLGRDGGSRSRSPQSSQSVPRAHCEYSAPGPPSSHSPSIFSTQVFKHTMPGERGGSMGGGGEGGLGGSDKRGPQSLQSVPRPHAENSLPAPPSSQSPSLPCRHVSWHAGVGGAGSEGGAAGGGGIVGGREPQSVQSEPWAHAVNSAPEPPSSHSPSAPKWQASEHAVGGPAPEVGAAGGGLGVARGSGGGGDGGSGGGAGGDNCKVGGGAGGVGSGGGAGGDNCKVGGSAGGGSGSGIGLFDRM